MATRNGTIEARDSQLAHARLVAIVVHGVGDHTPTDILGELVQGLKDAEWNVATESASLERFPQPDGTTGPQDVIWLRTDGERVALVPIVWSRLRMRAGEQISTLGDGKRTPPAAPFVDALVYLGLALPALGLLLVDCCRCIPKARRWCKPLLAGAAAVVIAATTLLVWMVLRTLGGTRVPIMDVNGLPAPFIVPLLLAGWAVLLLMQAVLPVLDFVGDVAAYIGRPAHRRGIEQRMAEIIRHVCEAAPTADVLVVGHSLGSVLVTHCLLDSHVSVGPGQLLLITLGSPLASLSAIFPTVQAPPELAGRYQHGLFSFWLNAWRSGDWVGKALEAGCPPEFSEACLGRGGHVNYWRDSRLWRLARSFLETARRR